MPAGQWHVSAWWLCCSLQQTSGTNSIGAQVPSDMTVVGELTADFAIVLIEISCIWREHLVEVCHFIAQGRALQVLQSLCDVYDE